MDLLNLLSDIAILMYHALFPFAIDTTVVGRSIFIIGSAPNTPITMNLVYTVPYEYIYLSRGIEFGGY
jgi:hypothetical protein